MDSVDVGAAWRGVAWRCSRAMMQLYRLASHLVYWNKASIIKTITKGNRYRAAATLLLPASAEVRHRKEGTEDSTLAIHSPLHKEFARCFPRYLGGLRKVGAVRRARTRPHTIRNRSGPWAPN